MSRIFISYCHKDLPWKERLERHLKPLTKVKRRQYTIWTDDQINAGEDWEKSIQAALEAATVAVLLITTDFLNSEFVNEAEVPRLLARRKQEGVTIIPIIVKPCLWKEIEWLSSMQCRPRGGTPLSQMKEDDADAALVQIAEELAALSEKPAPKPVQRFTISSFEIENFSGGATFGIGLGDGALLAAGQHDWHWVNPRKSISHRLSALPPFSCALSKGPSELVLALFDKKLAFLRNGDAEWGFVTMPQAVISLAFIGDTLFTGDVAGMVSSLQHDAPPVFWPASIREPVTQLLPLPSVGNDILLVLGASVAFGSCTETKPTRSNSAFPSR
ncbi:MAG: toll/interleukin-1 receptor domain-containing protein [Saprospirales bacterium]|nr:toll/interleukin-1 receptor domain-containing protein [Saprospirales bacterium]